MARERDSLPNACRRRFVQDGLRFVPAMLLLPPTVLLPGCGSRAFEDSVGPLTVPVAELPLDVRVRLENDGSPVEVLRTSEGIEARSLLCTHQGCRVRWHEDKQLYICPCHDGKFDAAGEVVYGMPTRPLRKLEVSIQNDMTVILPQVSPEES